MYGDIYGFAEKELSLWGICCGPPLGINQTSRAPYTQIFHPEYIIFMLLVMKTLNLTAELWEPLGING